MKLIHAVLIAFLVAGASALGAGSSGTADAASRPYDRMDLFQHAGMASPCFEAWSYELQLDTGCVVLVSFLRMTPGLLSGVCGVQVWVMKEGTPPVSLGREYPLERYHADVSAMKINWGKDNWVAGLPPRSHEVHVNIAKGAGIRLDAVLTNMVPGFVDDGDDSHPGQPKESDPTVMVAIPRARVTGTLTLGGETLAISGWAYAEHSCQSLRGGGAVARRWTARFSDAEHTIGISEMEDRRGTRHRLAFVTDACQVLEVFRGGAIETTPVGRAADPPARLGTAFSTAGQGQRIGFRATWRTRALLQKFNLTQDMSRIEALAVRWWMRTPDFYRFSNDYAIELTSARQTWKLSGTGFHEITDGR